MNREDFPVRHELKYYINPAELAVLRARLRPVMELDRHCAGGRPYHVRSLYFDDVFDRALTDKLAGVQNRDKYRIRIYNFSDKVIRMECKTKVGQLISKRSIGIPKLLAEQLIAGDPTGLERTRSGLLRDVYREMAINGLKPVVIVDYVREAYIHPAEEVRITFDKQLHTGLRSNDLFNPYVPTIPAFDHDEMILEVKFNRYLPPYIRELLSTVPANACAISKYTLCRGFEPLDE